MSPLPNLPSGETELPAARFIIFADDSHLVHKIDESAVQLSGISFDGTWESGCLNPDDLEGTLQMLVIEYISGTATTMTAKVSGDGGDTWSESKTVTIAASTGAVRQRARVAFNTSGYDLRVRLELDTDIVFYVTALFPTIVPRSEYVAEG